MTKTSKVLPELTEDEVKQALIKAREEKATRIALEEWNARIKKAVDWSRPNSRELYENLRGTKSHSGERFKLTDWNKGVVTALCLYFAGEKEFENCGEGFSLNKGVMLAGTPGTGKSHLMAFFTKNPHASYAHVTCKSIAEKYRTEWHREGLDTLEWYSNPLKAEFEHPWNQKELGYCFGDLGTEDEKKSFGNNMNVMEHIIFQRYENNVPFKLTHITTNLNASEIETLYGIRIRDRFREMFNKLKLEGESFR